MTINAFAPSPAACLGTVIGLREKPRLKPAGVISRYPLRSGKSRLSQSGGWTVVMGRIGETAVLGRRSGECCLSTCGVCIGVRMIEAGLWPLKPCSCEYVEFVFTF